MKDMKTKFGSLVERKFENIDGEKRFVPRFRITEKKVDRFGDVVMPGGVDMKNWADNPQVFFGHRSWTPPIGKGLPDTIDQNDNRILVDKLFDDTGDDDFATLISLKLQKGFLSRSSIGFMSKTIGEEPVKPKQTGITFLETELLESSIVPLPALPSAGMVKTATGRLLLDDIKREFVVFRNDIKDTGHEFVNEDVYEYIHKYELCSDEHAELLGFPKKKMITVPSELTVTKSLEQNRLESAERIAIDNIESASRTLIELTKNIKQLIKVKKVDNEIDYEELSESLELLKHDAEKLNSKFE